MYLRIVLCDSTRTHELLVSWVFRGLTWRDYTLSNESRLVLLRFAWNTALKIYWYISCFHLNIFLYLFHIYIYFKYFYFLYRHSDRRLSTKLVPTFEERGCQVVSVTDSYGGILGFLHQRLFLSSSSSFALTRLSGPRSRRTTSQNIW
jgi:hypothetical protein